QCRTAGVIEKTAAIRRRKLSVSFRDIQRNRRRGAIRLITNRCTPGQPVQKRVRPCDEFKVGLVNFRFFVVEGLVHWKRRRLGIGIRIRVRVRLMACALRSGIGSHVASLQLERWLKPALPASLPAYATSI